MAKKEQKSRKDLEAIVAELTAKFGESAVMKLKEAPRSDVDTIPTGSIAIDLALGVKGVPRGRVIEIYGPESSGKTTLCLHIIANAQKNGGVGGQTGEAARFHKGVAMLQAEKDIGGASRNRQSSDHRAQKRAGALDEFRGGHHCCGGDGHLQTEQEPELIQKSLAPVRGDYARPRRWRKRLDARAASCEEARHDAAGGIYERERTDRHRRRGPCRRQSCRLPARGRL